MSEANISNKALVRRWFEEVWNQGREETIDELFAANGIGYGLGDTDATMQRTRRNSNRSSATCEARCRTST